MPLQEIESLPPEQQLKELEDAYAECLIDADLPVLQTLWNQLKELRRQLAIPDHPDTHG